MPFTFCPGTTADMTTARFPTPYKRLFLFLTTSLLPSGTGCIVDHMRALETRIAATEAKQAEFQAALENEALRSDSVATGLEKFAERLDAAVPPSAQWLKGEKGAAIKWYLDDQAQNVYVQSLEPAPVRGSMKVAINTKARTSQHVMRPGEAVEHRWTDPVPARSFIITCHRLLYAEDGSIYGLFSIIEGPLAGQ